MTSPITSSHDQLPASYCFLSVSFSFFLSFFFFFFFFFGCNFCYKAFVVAVVVVVRKIFSYLRSVLARLVFLIASFADMTHWALLKFLLLRFEFCRCVSDLLFRGYFPFLFPVLAGAKHFISLMILKHDADVAASVCPPLPHPPSVLPSRAASLA